MPPSSKKAKMIPTPFVEQPQLYSNKKVGGFYILVMMLENTVTPIVLALTFFGLITPIAIITRLFGRDVLRNKHRVVPSYWIERYPAFSASDSFKRQY
jgi:hypothetical protein